MEQQKRIQLGTIRLQVRSLALLSGLRTQRCHELWYRSQTQLRIQHGVAVVQASSYSSDQTPSLGTSICHRCGPKKRKKYVTCLQCIQCVCVCIYTHIYVYTQCNMQPQNMKYCHLQQHGWTQRLSYQVKSDEDKLYISYMQNLKNNTN